MISQAVKDKLAKVYELVKRGGSEGEKTAAQKALDRLIEKYNLNGVNLDAIDKAEHVFKYSGEMDIWLMQRLVTMLLTDHSCFESSYRRVGSVKEISLTLTYLDYVTLEASYGYFKKHMNAQWRKFCLPNLKRCKTAKSRNKRREELKGLFFSRYGIESNLFRDSDLIETSWEDMSDKEKRDRIKLSGIEGGKYNRQMTGGLLLEM